MRIEINIRFTPFSAFRTPLIAALRRALPALIGHKARRELVWGPQG
ncbi:MAG: hypothetical protein WBO23_16145 [Burkholderiales bacterium]